MTHTVEGRRAALGGDDNIFAVRVGVQPREPPSRAAADKIERIEKKQSRAEAYVFEQVRAAHAECRALWAAGLGEERDAPPHGHSIGGALGAPQFRWRRQGGAGSSPGTFAPGCACTSGAHRSRRCAISRFLGGRGLYRSARRHSRRSASVGDDARRRVCLGERPRWRPRGSLPRGSGSCGGRARRASGPLRRLRAPVGHGGALRRRGGAGWTCVYAPASRGQSQGGPSRVVPLRPGPLPGGARENLGYAVEARAGAARALCRVGMPAWAATPERSRRRWARCGRR